MKIVPPNMVLESERRRGFRRTATEGLRNARVGSRGMPPENFFLIEGIRWLLVISLIGTFQNLKQLIFH